MKRRTLARTTNLILWTVASAATVFASQAAFAQSGPSAFFVQILRTNRDSRVRVNAALHIGQSRDATAVQPLIDMLPSITDNAVKIAVVSALASIGDARALPAFDTLARGSGDLAALARRSADTLRRASAPAVTVPTNATATASVTTSSASAKLLVRVGTVGNASGVAPALVQTAQDAMRDALAQRTEVLVHAGTPSQAAQIMRDRRLLGHSFSPNIQAVQPSGSSVHVEVNITVSSYPSGALEFDSPSSLTLSTNSTDTLQAQQNAVRRAVQAAVSRAITQLVSSP